MGKVCSGEGTAPATAADDQPAPETATTAPSMHGTPSTGGQATPSHPPHLLPEELSAEKLMSMNRELDDEVTSYEGRCAAVDADTQLSPETKERRLTSLKNGHATRKSQIRAKYNVRVRMSKDNKAARAAAATSIATPRQVGDRGSRASAGPQNSTMVAGQSSHVAPASSSSARNVSRKESRAVSHGSTPPQTHAEGSGTRVPQRGALPSSHTEYSENANKRQRTKKGDSRSYTAPTLENQNEGPSSQGVPLTPAEAKWAQIQAFARNKKRKTPAEDSEQSSGDTTSAGTGPVRGASTTRENEEGATVHISDDDEMVLVSNTTPNIPREATDEEHGESSVKKKGSPVRGTFTARRGKH